MKYYSKRFITTLAAAFSLGLASATAHASIIASEGFEVQDSGSGAYGWNDNSLLTRTANGNGNLGLTAPEGSYYAEIKNQHGTYSDNRYGGAGYSYFGGRTVYPGSAFAQSVDVYLDPEWTQVSSGPVGKFSIDFAASKPSLGSSDYGTESRFAVRLGSTQGTLDISARGNSGYSSVASPGWYTFEVLFAKGAGGTAPSTSTMNLYNTSTDDLIASQTFSNYDANHPNDSNYTTLSQDLGGTGFVQFFVWRNGFADDTLGIDNLQTRAVATAVPEPGVLELFGLGLLGLGLLGKKASKGRKQSN